MTAQHRLMLLPRFARTLAPPTTDAVRADARMLLNTAVMEPKWRLQQIRPNDMRAIYCGASRDDEGGEAYFCVFALNKKGGFVEVSLAVAAVLGWNAAQVDGHLCVGVPMPQLMQFPEVDMVALRGQAVAFLRRKLIEAMAWETPIDLIEL